ncbi:MAG TPA: RNA 2'-phosphotransferase [Micromonosporaceae bacterium]
MRRTHVHLSAEPATARSVGARHGHPVVLTVDAAGMHRHGFAFHLAANGVWLTRHVPPEWLRH